MDVRHHRLRRRQRPAARGRTTAAGRPRAPGAGGPPSPAATAASTRPRRTGREEEAAAHSLGRSRRRRAFWSASSASRCRPASSTTSNAGPEPHPRRPSLSPSTTARLSAGNDPSAMALGSLVVKPEDVPATADVVLFPGGAGLAQPTLDLCNGAIPSESKRTARIQDAVLDAQGRVIAQHRGGAVRRLRRDDPGVRRAAIRSSPPARSTPLGQPARRSRPSTRRPTPTGPRCRRSTAGPTTSPPTTVPAAGAGRSPSTSSGVGCCWASTSPSPTARSAGRGQDDDRGHRGRVRGALAALPTSVVGS